MKHLPLFLLVACGGETIAPTAESCAAICAAADKAAQPAPAAEAPAPASRGGATMTEYEQKILGPVLEDLRNGVRPFDDQSVGLCQGKSTCDRFIGTSSKGLEPGDYILQAVLAVPKEGDGWTITLATDCTTTKGDSTTNKSDSKDYELKYPGEGRGYKLVPLRRIKSPGTYGAQSCSWKITAPHPDGDKVYEGEWSVPEGA